jgi:dephospho-CoA kinase
VDRRPRRVALTGGIATGKSRCLAAIAALGVPTVDADRLAREVVAPGTPGLTAIVRRFGQSILERDGTIKRDVLGRIVFADADARRDLEAVIHPAVYDAITTWFAALEAPTGVADIPLLFETGRAGDFDVVIVAACGPEQQLSRLMARNGLTEADARARISAQLPLSEKIARADYVIDTSGTFEETEANARGVWERVSAALRQPPAYS